MSGETSVVMMMMIIIIIMIMMMMMVLVLLVAVVANEAEVIAYAMHAAEALEHPSTSPQGIGISASCTRHTSHVTRHTSHVTRHTPYPPLPLLFIPKHCTRHHPLIILIRMPRTHTHNSSRTQPNRNKR